MTVPPEKYTNERLSGDKKAPTHGEVAVSGRDALHPPSLYEKTENYGEEQKTEGGFGKVSLLHPHSVVKVYL